MSDFRDTRGGAYDHVNEFGKPQPPQVKDKATPQQKAQWGADVRPEPLPGPMKATHCRRDCASRGWVL